MLNETDNIIVDAYCIGLGKADAAGIGYQKRRVTILLGLLFQDMWEGPVGGIGKIEFIQENLAQWQ